MTLAKLPSQAEYYYMGKPKPRTYASYLQEDRARREAARQRQTEIADLSERPIAQAGTRHVVPVIDIPEFTSRIPVEDKKIVMVLRSKPAPKPEPKPKPVRIRKPRRVSTKPKFTPKTPKYVHVPRPMPEKAKPTRIKVRKPRSVTYHIRVRKIKPPKPIKIRVPKPPKPPKIPKVRLPKPPKPIRVRPPRRTQEQITASLRVNRKRAEAMLGGKCMNCGGVRSRMAILTPDNVKISPRLATWTDFTERTVQASRLLCYPCHRNEVNALAGRTIGTPEGRAQARARNKERALEMLGGKCFDCGSEEKLSFETPDGDFMSNHLAHWTPRVIRYIEQSTLICEQCRPPKRNRWSK